MLEIANNAAEKRWEARLDGELAGYAEYRASPRRVVFTHTVVEPRFEGRGIGSGLAKTALDAAVAAGQRIVPYCPFVSAYLRRHHEYEMNVDWPRGQDEE
ncbi:MAG TPA: GNAT family N-acetyltransferase [Candidatus Limnocylindria bacterium]|nr:GNAT family N-acetyltransferase [Candidatus Limnocylindria bacterium]